MKTLLNIIVISVICNNLVCCKKHKQIESSDVDSAKTLKQNKCLQLLQKYSSVYGFDYNVIKVAVHHRSPSNDLWTLIIYNEDDYIFIKTLKNLDETLRGKISNDYKDYVEIRANNYCNQKLFLMCSGETFIYTSLNRNITTTSLPCITPILQITDKNKVDQFDGFQGSNKLCKTEYYFIKQLFQLLDP